MGRKREVRRTTLSSDDSEWPDYIDAYVGIILFTKTRESVPVGPGSPSFREPSVIPNSGVVLLYILRVPLILVSLSLRILFTQTLLFFLRKDLTLWTWALQPSASRMLVV